MKVVSSAKLKTNIKENLISGFPKIQFHFKKDINEAIEELVDACVLITYGEDLTNEIIMKAEKLEWIMVISAGLDRMPFEAIKKKGILVTNARGIHKIPMAEYAISMMLQVMKRSKKLMKNEESQIWDRSVPMEELFGKTLGILGAGSIGTQIAKYAKVFNMKTIGFNRSGKHIDEFEEIVTVGNLQRLLSQSDVIVSVLPSTSETNGMLNKRVFQQVKQGCTFINIGRGKNVVEVDLIEALKHGKVGHAVLDVFEFEPLPKNHPFWEMENVTITPHLSAITSQYQTRAIDIFMKNLLIFQDKRGDLLNKINLDKGY